VVVVLVTCRRRKARLRKEWTRPGRGAGRLSRRRRNSAKAGRSSKVCGGRVVAWEAHNEAEDAQGTSARRREDWGCLRPQARARDEFDQARAQVTP